MLYIEKYLRFCSHFIFVWLSISVFVFRGVNGKKVSQCDFIFGRTTWKIYFGMQAIDEECESKHWPVQRTKHEENKWVKKRHWFYELFLCRCCCSPKCWITLTLGAPKKRYFYPPNIYFRHDLLILYLLFPLCIHCVCVFGQLPVHKPEKERKIFISHPHGKNISSENKCKWIHFEYAVVRCTLVCMIIIKLDA